MGRYGKKTAWAEGSLAAERLRSTCRPVAQILRVQVHTNQVALSRRVSPIGIVDEKNAPVLERQPGGVSMIRPVSGSKRIGVDLKKSSALVVVRPLAVLRQPL